MSPILAIALDGTQDAFIVKADLIISAGMLALAVAYLLAGRGRQESANESAGALATRVLDWRLLALLCIPLAILTYERDAATTAHPRLQ
jgi:hypothetical protein